MAKPSTRARVLRGTTATMLAAMLTVGSVPAVALAQVDEVGGGSEAVALAFVETGDGFYLEDGKAYTVPVSFLKDATNDPSMSAQFFSENATVVYSQGAYAVDVTLEQMASVISSFKVNGVEVPSEAHGSDGKVFHLNLDTVVDKIDVSVEMMGSPQELDVKLDTSSLPTVPEEPSTGADLVDGTTYAIPLDLGGSMAGSMLGENAVVTPTADGKFDVVITVKASDTYLFSGLTVGGVEATRAWAEDGSSYVFTAKGVSAIDGAVELGFTYTPYGMWKTMIHSANATFGVSEAQTDAAPPAVQQGVVKADLENAIAAAKKVEQGKKSDEAWTALQDAIATSEKAAANSNVPQAGVDGATNALIEAVQTFVASPDVPGEGGGETDGDYGMVVGSMYEASVSYKGTGATAGMDEMLQQMIGKYFGDKVKLERLSDGTFNVVVYFGGTTGYDDAIGDITYNGKAVEQSADQTYTINVAALNKPIELGLHVGGVMNMDISYAMVVDTNTIKLLEGGTEAPVVDKSALEEAVKEAEAIQQGEKSDEAWASLQESIAVARTVLNDPKATQDAVNNATTALKEAVERFNASVDVAFQVGHTYQVPIAFFKHGSVTEKSMAAQYFGDTALVRPQTDGTFKVSFSATNEGMNHIVSLAYNGAVLAQNGSEFSLTAAAATADTVLPLDMTIKEMQELGAGPQTADMHLYLTQAKDLGTGKDGQAASSANLARTGDNTPLGVAAGAVAVAAIAVAGAAARRRMSNAD